MTLTPAASLSLRPQRLLFLVFHALSMLCFSTAAWSQTRPAAEIFGENRQALTVPGIHRMGEWVFSTYQESNPAYDDPDMEEIALDEAQLGAIGQLPLAAIDPADLKARKGLGRDLTMFIMDHGRASRLGIQLEVNGLVSIESLRIGDDVRSVVAAPASNFKPVVDAETFVYNTIYHTGLWRAGAASLIWFEFCPQGELETDAWIQVRKHILRTWGSGLEASMKGKHLPGFTPGWLRYGPQIPSTVLQDADQSLLFELAAQRPHDRNVLDALIQCLNSAGYTRLAIKVRDSLPAPATDRGGITNVEPHLEGRLNNEKRILEERNNLKAQGLVLTSPMLAIVIETGGRLPFTLGDSGSLPEKFEWLLHVSSPSQPIPAATLLDRQLGLESSALVVAELAGILNDLGAPATAYTLARQALMRESDLPEAGTITHRALHEALRSLYALEQKTAATQLLLQTRTAPNMPVDISPSLAALISWAEGA